jgi:hypothetical protein
MRAMAIFLLLGSVAITGCEFAAGAATGALATGAGYEYNSKRQMDRLEDDIATSESAAANTNNARSKSSTAPSFTNQRRSFTGPAPLYR